MNYICPMEYRTLKLVGGAQVIIQSESLSETLQIREKIVAQGDVLFEVEEGTYSTSDSGDIITMFVKTRK